MAAPGPPRIGFRLVSPDGDTLGTIVTRTADWRVGDTVTVDGVRYRVRSVIPPALIAEFVDAPLHGLLEVEPI